MTDILRKFIVQKPFPCVCDARPTRCTDVSYVLESEVIEKSGKWLSIITRNGEFDHTNFVSYLNRLVLYENVCDRCAVLFMDKPEFEEICLEFEKLGFGKVRRFVQSQTFSQDEAFRLMNDPAEIFNVLSGPHAHRELTSLVHVCDKLANNVVVACHDYESEYSAERLSDLFRKIMDKKITVEEVLVDPIYQLTLNNMAVDIGWRK